MGAESFLIGEVEKKQYIFLNSSTLVVSLYSWSVTTTDIHITIRHRLNIAENFVMKEHLPRQSYGLVSKKDRLRVCVGDVSLE